MKGRNLFMPRNALLSLACRVIVSTAPLCHLNDINFTLIWFMFERSNREKDDDEELPTGANDAKAGSEPSPR